jgi:hypothetical protein
MLWSLLADWKQEKKYIDLTRRGEGLSLVIVIITPDREEGTSCRHCFNIPQHPSTGCFSRVCIFLRIRHCFCKSRFPCGDRVHWVWQATREGFHRQHNSLRVSVAIRRHLGECNTCHVEILMSHRTNDSNSHVNILKLSSSVNVATAILNFWWYNRAARLSHLPRADLPLSRDFKATALRGLSRRSLVRTSHTTCLNNKIKNLQKKETKTRFGL